MKFSDEDAFDKIYEKGIWGNGTSESPSSGTGSNPSAAIPYVDFIRANIRNLEIKSVLDLGHGDWAMWENYKFEDTSYLGVDVVQTLSTRNTEKYGSRNVEFRHVDIGECLPKSQLLICKDVLQHLSNVEICRILSQLCKYQYVIFCNDIELNQNAFKVFRFKLQLSERFKRFKNLLSPFYRVKYPFNNSEIQIGGYRGIDLEDPLFLAYFSDFVLEKKFDFTSPYFGGTTKRVYFWRRY